MQERRSTWLPCAPPPPRPSPLAEPPCQPVDNLPSPPRLRPLHPLPGWEVLRRWKLSLEQLREIERVVEEGAIQALKVRSGKRARTTEVSPQAFEQLRRELLTKEKALAEMAVELALTKKGLNWGSTSDAPLNLSPPPRSR